MPNSPLETSHYNARAPLRCFYYDECALHVVLFSSRRSVCRGFLYLEVRHRDFTIPDQVWRVVVIVAETSTESKCVKQWHTAERGVTG